LFLYVDHLLVTPPEIVAKCAGKAPFGPAFRSESPSYV